MSGPTVLQSVSPDVEILTVNESAKIARCSKGHLLNACKGKIPGVPKLLSVRVGRRVLIRRQSLYRWLEALES